MMQYHKHMLRWLHAAASVNRLLYFPSERGTRCCVQPVAYASCPGTMQACLLCCPCYAELGIYVLIVVQAFCLRRTDSGKSPARSVYATASLIVAMCVPHHPFDSLSLCNTGRVAWSFSKPSTAHMQPLKSLIEKAGSSGMRSSQIV